MNCRPTGVSCLVNIIGRMGPKRCMTCAVWVSNPTGPVKGCTIVEAKDRIWNPWLKAALRRDPNLNWLSAERGQAFASHEKKGSPGEEGE